MSERFDVAVIGGGPAGLMAAGTAANHGARVVLLEKNRRPGKKLLLTGKGRCNITHAEYDTTRFIEKLGKNGKFLFSALQHFGVGETVEFFNGRGLETKVERGSRVFPASERAADVLRILLKYLKETDVKMITGLPVIDLESKRRSIVKAVSPNQDILADKYILCTGGLSYPATGSAGDGLKWIERLGHTIIKPVPGLVPLKVKEKWVNELKDLTLKNVRITLYLDNKKKDERFGEAQFIHDGIGGPVVLDMSRNVGRLSEKGPVQLHIDLKPALEYNKLDARVLRDFREYNNKMFRNSLDKLLPRKLIPVIVKLSGIDLSRKVNSITREERKRLVHLLKELSLNVRGLYGFEKALITAGGVSLKEIDPRTMRSKLIENLYFAGEILDLDGPTGGYNLQICWSTGYTAGKKAAE